MPHTRKLTPHHRTPPILLQPSPMPTPTNANPKSIPTPPLRVQTVVVKGKKHRFFIFGVSLCSPSPLFFSPVLRFILSKLVLGLGLDDFFKRCTQSIGAVCNLKWPKSKILIQVLDDSDDPTTQLLIKDKVHRWKTDDANIVCRHRVIRDGYKAGNLKSAMNCRYVKDYEFVAIFDADFQPNPDFLMKTVSHFKDNEELGLEQARWSFVIRD